MARTLHLLFCISAAVTATAGQKYPYGFELWETPFGSGNAEPMGFASRDRINARSTELSSEEMVRIHDRSSMAERRPHGGSYKIMNHGPRPVPISRRREGGSEDRVLFPGPTSRNDAMSRQSIPEECQKHKLCDNVPDYPVDIANDLIAKLGDKIKYLPMDKLEDETPEITQRLGKTNEDLDLCDSQVSIKYPKGGFDQHNVYHDVLNNAKNPIQAVRVEICTQTDSPCKKFVCFERNYVPRCVQKYTYRPMLTIDKVTKEEVEVQISVPTCCACVVKAV